jgi:hypothetical protein
MDIGKALSEITNIGSVFAIGYRKKDGNYGFKERVVVRNNNNPLNARKKFSRSGLIRLRDLDSKKDFEIYIDLMVELNGQKIVFK